MDKIYNLDTHEFHETAHDDNKVKKVSSVLGADLVDGFTNEKVGTVHDLILDFRTWKITYIHCSHLDKKNRKFENWLSPVQHVSLTSFGTVFQAGKIDIEGGTKLMKHLKHKIIYRSEFEEIWDEIVSRSFARPYSEDYYVWPMDEFISHDYIESIGFQSGDRYLYRLRDLIGMSATSNGKKNGEIRDFFITKSFNIEYAVFCVKKHLFSNEEVVAPTKIFNSVNHVKWSMEIDQNKHSLLGMPRYDKNLKIDQQYALCLDGFFNASKALSFRTSPTG